MEPRDVLPVLGFRRRRTKHVFPASAAIQKVCRWSEHVLDLVGGVRAGDGGVRDDEARGPRCGFAPVTSRIWRLGSRSVRPHANFISMQPGLRPQVLATAHSLLNVRGLSGRKC